jgi:hypothetical protein
VIGATGEYLTVIVASLTLGTLATAVVLTVRTPEPVDTSVERTSLAVAPERWSAAGARADDGSAGGRSPRR